MRDKVLSDILSAAVRLIGRLPLGVHRFNARWLAFVIEKIAAYRVRLVDENLRNSFPEKTDAERLAIRHEFYRHFARLAVEAIWFSACTDPRRLRRAGIVKVKNPELLKEVYDSSPSVMVMYTHQGNWELLGGMANYTDFPGFPATEKNFCVVYRKGSSAVGDEVIRRIRFAPVVDKDHFDGYQESRDIIRYAFRHKADRKIYNMNTDQHPYFSAPDYLVVKFFGRECDTMTGSAALACKFRMGLLYQRMLRTPDGNYEVEYELLAKDASTMGVEDIMKRYYELLEEDIRRQPYNYLWTHNRWWRMPR